MSGIVCRAAFRVRMAAMPKKAPPQRRRETTEARAMQERAAKRTRENMAEYGKRAADAADALEELMEDFRKERENPVRVTFEDSKYTEDRRRSRGSLTEVECTDAFWDLKELGGYPLHRANSFGGAYSVKHKIEWGPTIIGVSDGKAVFPSKIVHSLHPGDVREFAQRLKTFPKVFSCYATEGVKVIGVIIFTLAREEKNNKGKMENPVKLALKAGLLLLQATGKGELKPITSPAEVATRP